MDERLRLALPMPLVYSATFVYLPIVKRLDYFEVAVHVSRCVLLVTFCARLLSLSLKDQLIGRWLSQKLLEICTLTSAACGTEAQLTGSLSRSLATKPHHVLSFPQSLLHAKQCRG